MNRFFASLFGLALFIAPVFASGTLTLLGAGSGSDGSIPANIVFTNNTFTCNSTGSTCTFTAVPIGTATADRLLVFGIASRGTASLTGVTVNGTAATSLLNVSSGGANPAQQTFWSFPLASGTTANVVATYSATPFCSQLGMWAAYNLLSTTPVATASQINTTPTSFSLTSQTDGIVAAMSAYAGTTSPTAAMSPPNQDFSVIQCATSIVATGGSAATPSTTQNVGVTFTGTFQQSSVLAVTFR